MAKWSDHLVNFGVNVLAGVTGWAATHALQFWISCVVLALAVGMWAGRASAPVAPCQPAVYASEACPSCPCACGCAETGKCDCCKKK